MTMAVDSGAASSKKKHDKNKKDCIPSPAKRNKSPGIRLLGGRIYDSVNGKSCHQCRQKTRDFTAACTNQMNGKLCPVMYCHKCLLNRYGENAEEVVASGEWCCPRCKGICNCSFCMKKRGHQPTGILIRTAKATGFSSVSEMLLNDGTLVDSPKKELTPSPRKHVKENSLDGKVDANLPSDRGKKNKSKKVKMADKGNKRKLELGTEDTAFCGGKKSKKLRSDRSDEPKIKRDDDEILKEKSVEDGKKKQKNLRKKGLDNDNRSNAMLATRTSPRRLSVCSRISNQEARLDVRADDEDMNCSIVVTKTDSLKPSHNDTIMEDEISTANALVGLELHDADCFPDAPLPPGTELNTVAGIGVSQEDIGNALQFLEFCAAFGEILEVKKGQPEHVLQDLFHGRIGRRRKVSVTVQFHIHLLSILQTERGEECGKLSPSAGKNSWFNAFKVCLCGSLKTQGLDCLENASEYDSLEVSVKLRLLNFLCDEILGTEKVRSWMDEQNTQLAEKVKEAKQTAKDEERTLKQKMKDGVAKAIIAKHDAPLSISEHEAIVSHVKRKAAEAHAKAVLESTGFFPENSGTCCNAIRVNPLLVGHGGNAYWKLNSWGNSNILHQDVGKGDTLTLNEKWFAIDDEGKEAIEKHICSLRGKRLRF